MVAAATNLEVLFSWLSDELDARLAVDQISFQGVGTARVEAAETVTGGVPTASENSAGATFRREKRGGIWAGRCMLPYQTQDETAWN